MTASSSSRVMVLGLELWMCPLLTGPLFTTLTPNQLTALMGSSSAS